MLAPTLSIRIFSSFHAHGVYFPSIPLPARDGEETLSTTFQKSVDTFNMYDGFASCRLIIVYETFGNGLAIHAAKTFIELNNIPIWQNLLVCLCDIMYCGSL